MASFPTMMSDPARQEEMNSLSCLLRTFLPDQQDFSFSQNSQQFLQRMENHEYNSANKTENMLGGLSEVAKRLMDEENKKYRNNDSHSQPAKRRKRSSSSNSDKTYEEESDADSDATIDLVIPPAQSTVQPNTADYGVLEEDTVISDSKNYVCFVCDCNFSSNIEYKNHMVNLCGSQLSHLRCIDCGNSFSSRSSLHSHEKLAPYELWVDKEMQKKPLYLQNYSNDSGASNEKSLVEEQEPTAEEKESMYLCNSCGKPIKKFRQFLEHIYSHGIIKPFRCALCSDSFESTCMLRFHIDTQHSQILPFQCKQCFRRFKLKCSLSTHAKFCKMDRSQLKYAEEIQFIDKLNQQRKFQGGGEDGLSQFSCPVCTVMFDSPEELHVHLLKHDETKPFHCEKCGQGFNSKLGHEKHMALHNREIIFTCEICGVELVTRSGYKAHLRGHKNIEALQAQAGLTGSSTALNASGSLPSSTEALVDKLYNDQFKVKKEVLSEDEAGPVNEQKQKTPKKKVVIPTYPCPMCDKMFFTGGSKFQTHVKNEHPEAPLEECDTCKKKFYGKQNLVKHKDIHRLYSQSFPCEECGRVFRKKYALEVHKKMHSFKKFVKCDICDQEFRFVSEVEKHKHTKHKYDRSLNIYKCNICGQKFPVLSHLSVHCYYHNSPDAKAFECDLCKLCFKTATELKQHIYQKHDHLMKLNADNEKILVASKGLEIPGYEIDDMEVDDVKKESPENSKGKSPAKSSGLMSARILTASGGMTAAAANKLACTTELLKGKDGESSMMRMVPSLESDGEEEKTEVEYSSVTGVDAYNMATRQNMLQSRFLKRFSCEVCTKTFASKSDLKTHLRTHSGETPFKCDYCDRSFKQRGHRKLHIQVAHTKEMPYKCDQCGSAFPTRYRYQIHVKRHGGIKEYQCAYCQKEFYTKGKMNEHKKNRHKEQWKEEQKMVGTLFE